MPNPLLPTYENVVASLREDGKSPPLTPTRVFAVAAIVLQIDGVRREEWTDDVEISPALFSRFPRGIVPSTSDLSVRVDTSYKVLDDTKPTRTYECMNCVLQKGWLRCHNCDGSGQVGAPDGIQKTCPGCDGTGNILCPVCEGERRAVSCTVRYVNDRPVHSRQVFVPQVHDSLRTVLASSIDPMSLWREDLAFDPSPSLVSSAYRGASAVRAEDNFHGHYFGAALTASLAAKDESIAGLARYKQTFFAIPVLWLVQEKGSLTGEDRHVAYFYDAARNLRVANASTSGVFF
ncbi:hypothetical protein BH09MYX1_BH09MYX1_53440 [soil metagenome]